MKTNYLILAMKRSGHHALINWIIEQSKNTVVHFNNCYWGWEKQQLISPKKGVYDKKTKEVDTIYNIEDFDLNDFQTYSFKDFNVLKENTHVILFTRDYYNWLASSYQRKQFTGDRRDTYDRLNHPYRNDRGDIKTCRIDLWKQHINECLHKSNLLNCNFVDVNYNKFVSEKDYRSEIANKLNLNFTDKGLNKVSGFGMGSSFDFTNFDNKAENMDVHNRWKNFINDNEYKSYIDEEAKQLCLEYFNIDEKF